MTAPLKLATVILSLATLACTQQAPTNTFKQKVSYKSVGPAITGGAPYQQMRKKLASVVITNRTDFNAWAKNNFAVKYAPVDSYGGSAAPISEDGYFLTACHILNDTGDKDIYIVHTDGSRVSVNRARVVWRSMGSDLAVLHIKARTPNYYQWSSINRGLPAGQAVYNGGIRWRDTLAPMDNCYSKCSLIYGWTPGGNGSTQGKLITNIQPNDDSDTHRKFKMSLRLMPGDSGGPIVDPQGKLIGINSAAEVLGSPQNPIFIDSIGVCPSPEKINEIISKDRA